MMIRAIFLSVICVLSSGQYAPSLFAGGYELEVGDIRGIVGESDTTEVSVESNAGEVVGWQFSICHDDDLVSIPEQGVSQEPLLADLDPFFDGITITPDYFSVGTIISGTGTAQLDATGDIYSITYDLLAAGDGELQFCTEDLNPAEVSLVVGGDAESVIPSTTNGALAIDSSVTFRIESRSLPYDPATGEGSGDVRIEILDSVALETTSFQMSMAYDDEVMDVTEIRADGVLPELQSGDGADFFAPNYDPVGGPGLTVGVYFALSDVDFFVTFSPEGDHVLTLTCATNPDNYGFDGGVVETDLTFVDGLGEPPIDNVVVVDDPVYPELESATLSWREEETTPFLRGDADGTGVVFPILDALFILEFGFTGGPEPPCMDSADVDDDGTFFAILDALHLLEWGFTNGDDPPDPGPDSCGVDPTPDDVDCETGCP